MNLIDAEYHAFGPWIIEVPNTDLLPPLFIPYYTEDNNYLMLIKIPRNIDRRQATPGMDLYDYVIGVYEDFVYILERKEKKVEEIKFSFNEIEGLENHINLLLGKLSIYLKDKKIEIYYNTVSEKIIAHLMKIIRDKYCKRIYKKIQSFYDTNQDISIDILYTNLLNEMESHGDTLDIMAIQPSIKLQMTSKGLIQKLFQTISKEKLLNTIHLSNDRELLILSRDKSIRKRKESPYCYTFTYIPIEKLLSVEFEKDENYNNLLKLYLKIKEHTFMFYLDSRNKVLQDYYKNLANLFTNVAYN